MVKIFDYKQVPKKYWVKVTCTDCEKECTNMFIDLLWRINGRDEPVSNQEKTVCFDCFKSKYQELFTGDNWNKNFEAQVEYDKLKGVR